MRIATKLRFAVLFVGTLMMFGASVHEVTNALRTGIAALPAGKHGPVFAFTWDQSPLGFVAGVSLFAAFAALTGWFAARQALALLQQRDPKNEQFIREQVTAVEQLAPSGLRPLWVGMLVVTACIAVYSAIATK